MYAYFSSVFSTLTAHFEDEFSTPHPGFLAILGLCMLPMPSDPVLKFCSPGHWSFEPNGIATKTHLARAEKCFHRQ